MMTCRSVYYGGSSTTSQEVDDAGASSISVTAWLSPVPTCPAGENMDELPASMLQLGSEACVANGDWGPLITKLTTEVSCVAMV